MAEDILNRYATDYEPEEAARAEGDELLLIAMAMRAELGLIHDDCEGLPDIHSGEILDLIDAADRIIEEAIEKKTLDGKPAGG